MLRPVQSISRKQTPLPPEDCLAKTIKLADGTIKKGATVSTHCRIVGYVAQELIHRQPQWLQDSFFPTGCVLVAAAHDLGKISPHFQEKIHAAAGKKLDIGNTELESTIGGHAAVSQACIKDSAPRFIPEILGRHHGASPTNVGLPCDEIYGGPEWQQSRMNLLNELKNCFACEWPKIENETQADVLSGFTCVADWIGSGSFFDEIMHGEKQSTQLWKERTTYAVDSAGFVGFKIHPGLNFEDVFSFQPREAQSKLIQAADRPGVYILEAPMGMGKTEAALYAAYNILTAGRATGLYFALPTQLTSDRIYERMNDFLGKILTEDCKFRSLLLHSSAWLRDTEIGEEGMPGREWFSSRKRGLLAPFAVGTIDQALMGVMNVKHGFVRAFGLAGKVVILDEVHSYDCYTGTIMDKLVQTLRKLQCTVIILSATLTGERRAELLGQQKNEAAYPLVSASPNEKNPFYLPVTQTENATVAVSVKNDANEALEEVMLRAERGEQILWIENTVAESQEWFKIIAARAAACNTGIECGLLHSRYLRIDRQANEEKWVKTFGKGGHALRKRSGRILIGTQVLEQSLDIDADFLVTRLCPTDMLFQRIGRLWRHREADMLRPAEARREAWIIAPTLDSAREETEVWGNIGKVYLPYVLYRSLKVFLENPLISLPQDIRPMLESTYAGQNEEGILNTWKADVEANRQKLAGLARISLSSIGKTLPESKATTRYSETESCEVLLIRCKTPDDTGTVVTFLNGKRVHLPINARIKALQEWRCLAVEIQKNVVIVPEYYAPETTVHQIEWLRDFVYLGNRDESPFRVAIIRENGSLCGLDNGDALQGYELSYTPALGYRVQKSNNSYSPNDSW